MSFTITICLTIFQPNLVLWGSFIEANFFASYSQEFLLIKFQDIIVLKLDKLHVTWILKSHCMWNEIIYSFGDNWICHKILSLKVHISSESIVHSFPWWELFLSNIHFIVSCKKLLSELFNNTYWLIIEE